MPTAGYSGTPLAKKLGIKSGSKLMLINEPAHYFDLFTDMPLDVIVVKNTDELKASSMYSPKTKMTLWLCFRKSKPK